MDKTMSLIRVYVDANTKKKVAEVSGKLGAKESAWVRMLIIRELKEIEKEES